MGVKIVSKEIFRTYNCEYYGCNNTPDIFIGHEKVQFDNMYLCKDHAIMLRDQLNELYPADSEKDKKIVEILNTNPFDRIKDEAEKVHKMRTGLIPAKPAEKTPEGWDAYDDRLDAADHKGLMAEKAHKLRTYAKLRYNLTFVVGTTKVDMVEEILKARG